MNEKVKIMIVGNKSDLTPVVDCEKAKLFAEENQMLFFETSAKEGTNIKGCFEEFFNSILDEQFNNLIKKSQNYFHAIKQEKNTNKKNCC